MKITNKIIFWLILLVAIVLRLINYSQVKFTHDEFSALHRLRFDNFSDLVEYGVKVDGHPAGIQVLLYYWGLIFGHSEAALKFPFVVMGVLAVALTYWIGKRWFNETVALLSMAFVATIQYSIAYSLIARPYISGLFTCLLMVYFLSRLLQDGERKFWRNGILFSLSITLCAYNHHFSLLFAAIVAISGVFLIPPKWIGKYIILGILSFILYIPALPVFFYQLKMGGVEQWLGKPNASFIWNYLFYIFHFSLLSISVVVGIFFWALRSKYIQKINYKIYILFFIWFIISFLIGYYYSVYRLAVLQFSVLIFSFTFIIFLLFGYLKNLKPIQNAVLVILVMGVNIFTLVQQRKHYQYYHKSIYLELLKDNNAAQLKYENVAGLIFSHERITNYYLKQNKWSQNFRWDDFVTEGELKDYLEEQVKTTDYLFFGAISQVNPTHIPIIKLYYPYLIEFEDYFDGSTYLFSKKQSNVTEPLKVVELNTFEEESPKYWSNFSSDNIIRDSETNSKVCEVPKIQEWGPKVDLLLEDMALQENDFIDIQLRAKNIGIDTIDAVIIVQISYQDSVYYWTGNDLKKQLSKSQNSAEWNVFVATLKLADINFPKGSQLTLFLWNRAQQHLYLDDVKITVRNGNNILYGVTEPLY